MHYADTYESVKTQSKSLAGRLQEKVVFFYDEASTFVGMLIRVLSDRQDELVKYVRSTYSNVTVFVHDNWLRLDFNKDGSVSAEDLRKNLKEFYDFLKNYHYVEETMRISSSLYDEAKKLIRSEKKSGEETTTDADNKEIDASQVTEQTSSVEHIAESADGVSNLS